MPNLRPWVPVFVLLVGCALVSKSRLQRAVPLSAPLSGVLATVGYRFTDQTVGDEERRVAGMSSYVARVYWRVSVPVFTTYVGSFERQALGRTIHSPRNCLPGAGWEVLTPGVRSVNTDGATHELNHYVLKNGKLTAIVYYWYQGRGRVVAGEYQVKWNLLRDAALLGHTEEALVRLIIPVGKGTMFPAASAENKFAEANAFGDSLAARMILDVARALPGGPRAIAASN
jgi:EpsI family protein